MIKFHDIPYLQLVEKVLSTGIEKTDRTGTGTLSIFSHQMRFDLSDGSIPLLTTKKMHLRSIIQEIFWYLKGSTNTKFLRDNKVTIWDEWADEDGNLGPIYGSQWRHWPLYNSSNIIEVPIKKHHGTDASFIAPDDSNYYRKMIQGEGCLGVIEHKPVYYTRALKLWASLLLEQNKCKKRKTLTENNFVDQQWRCFSNFLRDITELPHFHDWVESNEYVLTKDYYVAQCWSRETCIFIHKNDQELLQGKPPKIRYSTYGENTKLIGQSLEMPTTKKNRRVVETKASPNHVFRYQQFVDQVADVIDKIKNTPNDRRMIVSAWNVGKLDDMKLPPCHYTFQFWVADGKLSCMLNQRSADVGLGVPFNIVQYSILTHMFAQVTGLQPGEFIWNGGDVHIYKDHIEPLKTQLSRIPNKSPKLKLNTNVKNIDDFKYDDFEIVGYTPQDSIKMNVSI